MIFGVLLLGMVYGYPAVEQGKLYMGEQQKWESMLELKCIEGGSRYYQEFLYTYSQFQPQLIIALQNVSTNAQYLDYSIQLMIDVDNVDQYGFNFTFHCSPKLVKSVLFHWYVVGGEMYESACVDSENSQSIILKSGKLFLEEQQVQPLIAGFVSEVSVLGDLPHVKLYAKGDRINVTTGFQIVRVCYLKGLNLNKIHLNETGMQEFLQRGDFDEESFDNIIIGLQSFEILGKSFQFAVLNNKSFLPPLNTMKIAVLELNTPRSRVCARVYLECGFMGEPILVCEDDVIPLTQTWKKFKSLQTKGQVLKFDTKLIVDDPIQSLSDDIPCTYDMQEYLIEIRLNKKKLVYNSLFDVAEDESDEGQEQSPLTMQKTIKH